MCLKRAIAIMKLVWQLFTWMLWRCIFDESNSSYERVMAAVSKHGRALRHASRKLTSNYNIVVAAVSQDGFALEVKHNRDTEHFHSRTSFDTDYPL